VGSGEDAGAGGEPGGYGRRERTRGAGKDRLRKRSIKKGHNKVKSQGKIVEGGKLLLWSGMLALVGLIASPTMGQQSLYRLVQGKVIPKNSRDWTVITERLEITGLVGLNLICRPFTEQNAATAKGGTGNMRLTPVYHKVKTYLDPFVLTNYPSARGFKRGDIIEGPIMAMRVGTQGAMAIMDYGTDYTPPAKKPAPQDATTANKPPEKRADPAAAATFRFHEDRALAGNAGSQFRLAQLYLEGKGCERDTNQAKMWFRKAADQGNDEAAAELRRLGP